MAPRKTTKAKPTQGKCIDCRHAYVMSDGVKGNPLIAECDTDGTRYPQSWLCCIGRFKPREGDMEVHPMKYLNRHKQ